MDDPQDVAQAVWGTFRTPNEVDSNGEPANMVDGLFAIARAIDRLAEAVDRFADEYEDDDDDDDED
jgi:hypothetical protein